MAPRFQRLHNVLAAFEGAALRVVRWFDALWGYDVFIAHRRRDASEYARALYDKLTAEKISCFIDRVVYGPGDSLLVATQRHVAKSTVFLLVGSPELLIMREPVDWVEREINTFLNLHRNDPKLLLVDIGDTIANASALPAFKDAPLHPIVSLIREFIWISQASTALTEPPTDEVLAAVRKKLDGRRRDRTRLLFFQLVAGILFALVILAIFFGAQSESRRQAAEIRSGQLLGTRAQQLAQQPVTNETAPVIAAAAAYGWRLSRSADAWNAMHTLIWTGVSHVVLHDGDVHELAFSPDSRLTATASVDGKVRIARVADGSVQDIWSVEEQRAWANAVAFNRSGTRVAAGGGLGGYVGDDKWHGRARLFQPGKDVPVWDIVTEAPVYAIAFDPLDRFVAIGDDSGAVRLVDVNTGDVAVQIEVDRHPVRTLAFSRDGKRLAAGSQGGMLHVIATERQNDPPVLHRYQEKADDGTDVGLEVTRVAFSPADDQLLALALSDGTVRLRDAGTADDDRFILKHDGGNVNDIAFSSNGRMIASAGNDRTARVFDIENQTQLLRIDLGASIHAVAFSPDGRYLAFGAADKVARILSIPDRKIRVAVAHDGPVTRVRFSSDGRLLSTAGEDHKARILPIVDGFAEAVRISSRWAMRSLAFSEDGRRVAAGGDDEVALVRAVDGQDQTVRLNGGGKVVSIAFEPGADVLAMAAQEGGVKIVRLQDRQEVLKFPHDQQGISLAFSPDGKFFAAGGLDGTAELVRTADWKTSRAFSFRPERPAAPPDGATERVERSPALPAPAGGEEQVFAVAFSGESRRLAIGSGYISEGGIVRIIDLAAGRDMPPIPYKEEVARVAFSRNGTRLAIAGWNSAAVVELGDVPTLTPAPGPAGAPIALSPRGEWLAAGGGWDSPNVATVYPVGASRPRLRIIHGDRIEALAFSPNQSLLATASKDGTTRLIDLETGEERARISHEDAINAVIFSPDGAYIATGGGDGTARVWSTDLDRVLQRLCAGPGRNATLAEWRRYIGEIDWQRTCIEWPIPQDVKAAGTGG